MLDRLVEAILGRRAGPLGATLPASLDFVWVPLRALPFNLKFKQPNKENRDAHPHPPPRRHPVHRAPR
jgi:hypothetical protein